MAIDLSLLRSWLSFSSFTLIQIEDSPRPLFKNNKAEVKEAKHQDFIKTPTLTKHSKKIFSTSPFASYFIY